MLKFDEQWQLDNVNGMLSLRPEVEKIADELFDKSFDAVFFMGIGGTLASSIQVIDGTVGKSKLPFYAQSAAEYITNGNKRLTQKSVVVIASVTGTTMELIEAVKKVKEIGAKVVGFIETEDSTLAQMSDHVVSHPKNEQMKLFMLAHRLMYKNGEFEKYEQFYAELDKYLAKDLVEVEKKADEFGEKFAMEHKDDPIHYYIGAGNLWGAVYSYAMCYVEEQHWLRTKSIHAAEFLHGTLEVVDRDTNVTLFIGEDEERSLAERVARFLPKICSRYTIIDTKDYELEGISPEFRGLISYMVMHCVTQRMDAHIEKLNCHPISIRRYYRQLEY
ncbi:MAG: SIS domain-containing protein [Lachnospiraceae bacterium]|nr:SIS domain-containing protein [Lachnospiraceae bacterium]